MTLAKLWRRKWLIAAVAAAAVAAAGAIIHQMTPKYTAETRLRIGVPESRLAEAPSGLDSSAFDSASVQSEQYFLVSRELAARVADRLALEKLPEFNPYLREPGFFDRYSPGRLLKLIAPRSKESGDSPDGAARDADPPDTPRQDPQREATISVLLGNVAVEALGRSHVLAIKASSENPRLAAAIANGFGEAFLREKMVQRSQAIGTANEWLSKHIEGLRSELEKSEGAVEEYRREHALYSSRSDTITSQQMAGLNTEVIAAQAKLAEAETRLSQARETMKAANPGSAMPEVLSSPTIQQLKQQQSVVERRAAELSTKYGSKHPRMQDVQAERADVRRKITAEIENVVSGLRNEAASARARYETLKTNLDEIKLEMGVTNRESIKLRALEREAEANRAMFQQFLQRVKETEAQRDMKLAQSRIISQAAIPGSPSFPPVNMMLALALVGGLLGGVLLVLLIEQMDNTFRTDDDFESRTALPMLSVVPKVRRRHLKDDYVLQRPTSEFSESLRRLMLALNIDRPKDTANVVMMASSVPNEGKSGICLGVAKLAAASDTNVIVLDCDWRRPQLHSMVGGHNRLGIGELLTGKARPEDVVYRDSSGAHIIFAGNLRARQAHLICSDRMRYLLQSLTKHYDLVLVDTPPVLVGAEVLYLSRLVDRAVFVTRWGHTRCDVALKGLRQLVEAGTPLAGAVLSQVDKARYYRYVNYPSGYSYSRSAVGNTG